jgi:glycosyltransferase involved in cell wall biosynthesis
MILTGFRTLRLGIRSQAGLIRHIAYLGEACVVLRHAHRKRFTHIHAHFGTNAATVAMLVRNLGGPTFSFTIHGSGEWDCPEFLHLRQKVEDAEFVVAISDFAKSQTYRWTSPECWEKVHVVRCGVDRSFISSPVSPVPDVSRLVMIGRLGRSKGHVILLEALQQLVSEGIDFHMVLVGDGPLRAMIEHQINKRGLGEHIELAGWMDNNSVREEFLACRGMVLPSFSEGLPVVIMEALALGRPVVCTRVGGISELVVDQESGWLVSAGNVDELATALRKMLKTPVDELSRMGTVGREAVMHKHDSLAEATKLAALLRSHS